MSPLERYLTFSTYYRRRSFERSSRRSFGAALGGHDPLAGHRALFRPTRGEHGLNQLLYVDHKTFLPCLNLTYTDKMAMAASTEVRVPLLDDELVELAGRIPPELKLRRLTRKYLFKKSKEGVLPHNIVWRRKAGFGAPVRSWLVGDLEPMIEDLLSAETVSRAALSTQPRCGD